MTTNEYLTEVLESQKLDDGSKELKELQEHRADVEKLLRKSFEDSSPTIRYGGSKAKGTLILESYDLDINCYFPSDDTAAGESLEDIFNNVRKALDEKYYVTPKTSALRLKSKNPASLAVDFHIDVVPGRFVDGDDGDCFIYQSNAEKKRLKTNLDVHINHVKGSGVTEAIRLLKLWKTRKAIPVKQFVWELLIIKLLKGKTGDSFSEQLEHVWTEIINSKVAIAVEDPANPTGNDLSPVLTEVWQFLSSSSDATLKLIGSSGWEAVFGTTKRPEESSRIAALTRAVSAAPVRTKPWSSETE
jgi:hypothetical protein